MLPIRMVYNLGYFHWILHLLLISPTREYVCLKFGPPCDQPHIVGANHKEWVVVDLIGNGEGILRQ